MNTGYIRYTNGSSTHLYTSIHTNPSLTLLYSKIPNNTCKTNIFHYHWWTASIKPRLLFSHSGIVSWGLPFLQFITYCKLWLLFIGVFRKCNQSGKYLVHLPHQKTILFHDSYNIWVFVCDIARNVINFDSSQVCVETLQL